jgi:Sec-independent protein translocase protein TatA
MQVGDRMILGVAWSDDLLLLTTEDKLQKALDKIHETMERFKRQTNKNKVYVTPMWRKNDIDRQGKPQEEKDEERKEEKTKKTDKDRETIHNHNYKLGKDKIRMTRREVFLGFYLNHNINADKHQMTRAIQRGNAAEGKIKALHLYQGTKINDTAVKGMAEATINSTMATNLALHQMTTTEGHAAYDEPRRVQARTIKTC